MSNWKKNISRAMRYIRKTLNRIGVFILFAMIITYSNIYNMFDNLSLIHIVIFVLDCIIVDVLESILSKKFYLLVSLVINAFTMIILCIELLGIERLTIINTMLIIIICIYFNYYVFVNDIKKN